MHFDFPMHIHINVTNFLIIVVYFTILVCRMKHFSRKITDFFTAFWAQPRNSRKGFVQQLRKATFIKECLLIASDILCPEKKKLFESISLSANTVASRITELASNSYQQLTAAAKNFETFSLALDESTGVTDVSYCAVFIRGVDKDFNVTEE